MSIQYQIPKTSIFQSTYNRFDAVFNVPAPGQYDFNNLANTGQAVININVNSIYLINRITIGGTISQEQYLSNIATVPIIVLRYFKERQRVYPRPIPVNQYVDGLEAVAWFWSDMTGNSLVMDITQGVLNQSADLVGVGSVGLVVSLSIFEISDQAYVQDFKKSNKNTRIGASGSVKNNDMIFVR